MAAPTRNLEYGEYEALAARRAAFSSFRQVRAGIFMDSTFCHSERSEESSASPIAGSKWILRSAQNDKQGSQPEFLLHIREGGEGEVEIGAAVRGAHLGADAG